MKKITMLFTAVISVVVVGGLLSFLGVGRQFIINDEKIFAADADINNIFSVEDSEEVFNLKLNEMTSYFKSNGINTLIIPYNQGMDAISSAGGFADVFGETEYYENGDILATLKKSLKKSEIQMILKLDCNELDEAQISSAVEEINKEYHPAGILFSGYAHSNEQLQNIKMKINRRFMHYHLGLETDDIENAKLLQSYGAVDFYIFSDISDSEYKQLKNTDFKSAQIILSHQSADFEKNLFILSNFYDIDGVVISEYTSSDTDLSLYHNMMDISTPLKKFGLSVDNTFAVSHPSKDISTYYDGIYVAGIANPAQQVYINGQEALMGKDGSFGLFLELEVGENVIEVEQGDNYTIRTVNRKTYEYTGSSTSSVKTEWDETERAYKGQVVQTVNALTSILSNPDDDAKIMDGVPSGVQLVVEKSVKTMRDGKYTWAYILSNGGYILAKNVKWVDKYDYVAAELSSIGIEEAGDGNENLVLSLTGKPAIISSFKNSKVVFTMLNTELDENYIAEDEEYFVTDIEGAFTTECYVQQDGANTVLVLENNTENELWGYNIEYGEDDTVKIYLKKAPQKKTGAKPLKGVTVMLDAGHGGKDPGALAMGGIAGPDEKDINLAVTLATKECLERLGATVYLTRSDDTFLTLEERRAMVAELKPDLFIAQHHNSLEYTVDVNKNSGVESYYFTPQSATLAEIMAERISEATNRKYRGYGFGYFYVLRNDIAPSVLNEYGFVINPSEYGNLYSDEDIYKAAFATAWAVMDIIPE